MSAKRHAMVVALFDDKAAATQAMHALQSWEKAPEGVKLGALCVIAKGADGHVEYHRANVISLEKGVTFGLIAGAVIGGLVALPLGAGLAAAGLAGAAGVAATGATVGAPTAAYAAATGVAAGIVGATGTGAAGGVVGAATSEVSGLLWGFKHEDLKRVGVQLDDGKAAMLVLTEASEVEATGAELTRLGGGVEQYQVPGEALDHAAAAVGAADTGPATPNA